MITATIYAQGVGDSMDTSALGRYVKAARLAKKLTLADLGIAVGLSAATLSLVENGKLPLSYDNLQKIADVLDSPALLTRACGSCAVRMAAAGTGGRPAQSTAEAAARLQPILQDAAAAAVALPTEENHLRRVEHVETILDAAKAISLLENELLLSLMSMPTGTG